VDVRNIGSVKILEQSKLSFVKEVPNTEFGSTDRYYLMNIIAQEETVHTKEEINSTPEIN